MGYKDTCKKPCIGPTYLTQRIIASNSGKCEVQHYSRISQPVKNCIRRLISAYTRLPLKLKIHIQSWHAGKSLTVEWKIYLIPAARLRVLLQDTFSTR